MNQDKAREFFSAYYEDGLEAGLKQSFEARLKADATLRAEYASFVETMDSLSFFTEEEIEIPQNLSSKIATRLEEVQERKARSPFSLAFFRPLAFGGVAALALAGAILALRPGPTAGPATGSVIGGSSQPVRPAPVTDAVAPFEIAREGNAVILRTKETGEHTLTVDVEGQRERVTLTAAQSRKLENPNEKAALFRVGLDGKNQTTIIAVPGTVREDLRQGSGTIADFALALSSTFSVPVAVTVSDASKTYEWNLVGDDATASAATALGEGTTVDLSGQGVITIQAH